MVVVVVVGCYCCYCSVFVMFVLLSKLLVVIYVTHCGMQETTGAKYRIEGLFSKRMPASTDSTRSLLLTGTAVMATRFAYTR